MPYLPAVHLQFGDLTVSIVQHLLMNDDLKKQVILHVVTEV